MSVIRTLLALACLGGALYSVVAWAAWFNPAAFDVVALPYPAYKYPGGPQNGTLGASGLGFLLAWMLWPPSKK